MKILLIVCTALFGLFGIFIITTEKGDRIANILLGCFFLFWAIDFLDGFLLLNGFYLKHPDLALWTETLVFLFGPLLYFYTIRILRAESIIKWSNFLHLLPFLIFTLLTIPTFHLLDRQEKLVVLNQVISLDQSPVAYATMVLVCIHFTIYIIYSRKEVENAEKKLDELYSNYNLSWLKRILNVFLLILFISVLSNIFQFKQSSLYFEIALPFMIFVMTVFIVSVFWKSLKEPFVWLNERPFAKYEASQIELSEKEVIAQKITEALANDKVYLDPDLKLGDLAKKIGYQTRAVSQVINEVMDKSFFNLINYYRIEDAKSRLIYNKDSKVTVLEVMYQVGFNSKSSFNTQFKKQTGLTPTEFINSF